MTETTHQVAPGRVHAEAVIARAVRRIADVTGVLARADLEALAELARVQGAELDRHRERVPRAARALDALGERAERLEAESDRLRAENEALRVGLTAAHAALGRVGEVADWGVPVSPGTIRRALDCSQSLHADEQASADAARAVERHHDTDETESA